jgi:hypothetical protein
MKTPVFDELIGKTITAATVKKYEKYDDWGFLELQFTDGSNVIIEAGYGGYTGKSIDEYQTQIWIRNDSSWDADLNLIDAK